MENIDLVALSEGGSKDVKEITLKSGGKEYKAVFVMDFELYNKSYRKLMGLRMDGKNSNIDIDILGAGDKILFSGWNTGDDEIKRNLRLRTKACQKLGEWLLEIVGDDEEDEDSKKK